MNPRPTHALYLSILLGLAGCSGVDDSSSQASAQLETPPAVLMPVEAQTAQSAPAPAPVQPSGPPKPSLSRLTDKARPKLEFLGATIYADSISGFEAKGNVFVDGTNVHKVQRAFPLAVYAQQIRIDPVKGEATLSGWPIVQTDSAFVQGQAAHTMISLTQDRVAGINGPAKYVLGDKGAELFAP